MVKLASTKRKRTAQHGGTAGQMVRASHGHLNTHTQGRIQIRINAANRLCESGTVHLQVSIPRRLRLTQNMATTKSLRDNLHPIYTDGSQK